ncbi:MAG TPA: hypothetical protein P5056_01400 [Candidatus Paceibacterota bacterium]|nr:hypothetical protein [Candidatus Paceibacterota bacterium]
MNPKYDQNEVMLDLQFVAKNGGREKIESELAKLADYEKRLASANLLKYEVDLDVTPKCPGNLKIAEEKHQIASRVKGKIEVGSADDVKKLVNLHLDPGQMNGKCIGSHKLKKKLEGQPVYGAVLLDFLLEHPEFIPDEWKTKGLIYFWGTTFRSSGGGLCVRRLDWGGGRWYSDFYWLDYVWYGHGPAALRA